MNSIDRKILRCQREIEASRPKLMSFEEFEKGNHWLIDTSALTPWAYASSACITEADCRQVKPRSQVIPDRFGHTHMTDCECFECKPTFSLDLGSGEVKEEEPKFRVGDRVRAVRKFNCWYAEGDIGVVKQVRGETGVCVCFAPSATTCKSLQEIGTECHSPEDLELIPSPPTSDGWIPHDGKSGCPVPPGTVVDVRLRAGYEAKGQVALRFAGLANDEQWVESGERDELTIAAYRVIK